MLERFIAQYSDQAYQFAYRLCGNEEDAKELVQEAFFRIIRRWDQFDASQSLENWFLTVLRNLYYDGLRRYEKRQGWSLDAPAGPQGGGELSLAETVADGSPSLLDALEREESTAQVRRALDAISPEHRAILAMCDIDALSYEEIAAVLDCPVGTVRSRLSRARRALKRKLLETSEVSQQ